MKKNVNITFIGKTVILIAYVAVLIFIGTYRFANHDLEIKICKDNRVICDVAIPKYDVIDAEEYALVCNGIEQLEDYELKIYRTYKSVCVMKIAYSELWQYAEIQQDAIVFNEEGCKTLDDLASSYILERVIYAEWGLAIALFLWIIVGAIGEKFDRNNNSNHGPIYEIKRFCGELVKYYEYIIFSAKADLKAEVANSYLNRLWWVLEPFCNMLVYVIVFGNAMGKSVENYATFVFCALIMWNYFSHIITFSVQCIRRSKDIVTKIYMPKYVLLLSNMVLNFAKLIFSMLVLVVMLIVFKVHIGMNILWILPSYLLMFILCFGFGMIFMHYGVFVDDLSYAIGILITMLMFLSGIFYDVINTLREPLNVIMLALNPAAVFVDSMRNALLNNTITNVPMISVWLVLGILITYIGLHIIYKNENGYVKVI